MTLFAAVSEGVTEAREEIDDLVAESRAERRNGTRRTRGRKLAEDNEGGGEEVATTSRSRGKRTR
jgi:hypothetical protein